MKLWQKNYTLNQEIEAFTVGSDYLLDRELLPWDCCASQAHVKMLGKIGILTGGEVTALINALDEIISLNQKGEFIINKEDEDCHTAIENFLVKKIGKTGEKIHTGRSRNDQVLTAIRLYVKAKLLECHTEVNNLISILDKFIATNGQTAMPGYSHTRKAMPASVAMWAGAFRDAFSDDVSLLSSAQSLIDQNPLGTGAGFGVPLPIDRQMTTDELGFSKIMSNPIYAQNSRGKFEGFVLSTLTQLMADINRLATDLILFTMPGMEFFSLPDEFLTGSSIMPHKMNPDVLEILRGKYHQLFSYEIQVRNTTVNLISGYHRDIQLTKESMIRGFASALGALRMTGLIIQNLRVNIDKCQQAMTDELYSVEKVYQLVEKGISFREAYRIISEKKNS